MRHGATIDLVTDYGKKHEIINAREDDFEGSHFGADVKLLEEIENFYKGGSPIVSGDEGFEVNRMIAAAHSSADNGGRLILMKEIDNLK